ncbi:MAG: hypothetical protein M3R29_03800 [Verrucomicrobiota bacterium]|nr:hypothetical protein [Verrucomicrobiota bacterium]
MVILIILLTLVGGGVWWLYNNKKTMDREARVFGKEVVQRLAVNHEAAFLAERLSPAARLEFPPSQQANIMSKLQEMGVPAQPTQIEETVTFESHFFQPRGFFVGHLNYPGQAAVMEFGVSHPVSRWQIDSFNLKWERPR